VILNGGDLRLEFDSVSPLELTGAGTSVTGNGTLRSDTVLSNGAAIAPGNSPGMLTVDGYLTFGPAALYEWEVVGDAGVSGIDWDLLVVDGTLTFSATPDSPWILEINQWLSSRRGFLRFASPAPVAGLLTGDDMLRTHGDVCGGLH
jgi:hypothetical protein